MSLEYDKFGQMCKDIRVKMNLTQIDVEKAVGISRESLRILENGIRPLSVDLLNRLSYLYKIDLLDLLSTSRSSNDLFSNHLLKESISLLQERSFDTFRLNITDMMHALELSSKEQSSSGYSEYLKYLESFKDMNTEYRDRPKNKQNLELLLLYLSRNRSKYLSDNILLNLEIICGTMLAILCRVDGKFDKSLDILYRSRHYLESIEEKTPSQYSLLGGIYINEFYVYHRRDQYNKIISGIKKLFMDHNLLLPSYVYKDLLLRQGVAYLNIGESSKGKSILLSVLLNENKVRKKEYSDILYKSYNIQFEELMQ